MRLFILQLAIAIGFLTISSGISAQKGDEYIQALYDIWDTHYPMYESARGEVPITEAYELYNGNNLLASDSTYLARIKKAESELIGKDWGLTWRNSYLINSSPGLEMADNIIYRSRVQSEVQWNILRNGYYDRKLQSEILENESIIAEIEAAEAMKISSFAVNWYSIIYQFNKLKLQLLNQRLNLAKERVKIAQALHKINLLTYEDWIKHEKTLIEIQSLQNTFYDFNAELESSELVIQSDSVNNFPLIDIDYKYALNEISDVVSDTVKELILKNLELEESKWNRINLNTFARYNYYDLVTTTNPSRSFISFGLGLNVPISFSKKEREELYKLKRLQVTNEKQTGTLSSQNESLDKFYEFRYKLKQYNVFYYKKLLFQELLRKENARRSMDILGFNPLHSLRTFDELLAIDIELIDLKQQLYLKSLEIYTLIPHVEIGKLIKSKQLEKLPEFDANFSTSAFYGWKNLKDYEVSDLVNILSLEDTDELHFSIDKDKDATFYNTLSNNFDLIMLIGKNSLLDDTSGINEYAEILDKHTLKGIHLDVEPHAHYADFKDNKELYLQNLHQIILKFKSLANAHNLPLYISIPTHYPVDLVKTYIEPYADRLYFMCYENIKADFIQRKLAPYSANKTIIALRIEDFNNREELELKKQELKKLDICSGFIIHDLTRFITWKQ